MLHVYKKQKKVLVMFKIVWNFDNVVVSFA